jgi:antitoxin (DNA-binding transcriptional repressor) of toxin-antitoxin stability system
MRTAQANEMKERWDEVLEAVKNGETVQIQEGNAPVAQLVPEIASARPPSPNADQTALEAHIDELVRQGKVRRGTGTLPPDFFTRELPRAKKSVLEALLQDRYSD